MRIEQCSVSGAPMYPGHGITFVRNDGKVFRFSSKKARKLFERRVNPNRLRWTKAYRRKNGKELSVDNTFEFEKKRNVPVKYDRELYAKTIHSIKRVNEIQEQRQRAYYFKRMVPSLKVRKMQIARELKTNIDLIYAPVSAKRSQEMAALRENQAMLDTELKLQNTSKKSTKRKQSEDDDVEIVDNE
ncbi:ribosomal protein L24E [Naegleria gruberi]|uniref:Ribosomal protein L24E n=1 Tax=Naegleria gruberi TaxID=5762 RepID=D2VJH1_NAEGR|nr:ribosomal protein L24E [Naegleria gruberi]EFC43038.1 ribosomal protein L24E [Naegleria gruberi]|eukprot:XP_002675782.1 ribosomal protein L24E [Naegleria gruberi strain NEG-M]